MDYKKLKIIAMTAMLFDHVLRIFPLNSIMLSVVVKLSRMYPLQEIFISSMMLDTIPSILMYIGRLAAPIFMFCIANGYFHTSNARKYMIRIFAFGVIAQIPYILFFQAEGAIMGIEVSSSEVGLNIMFTLGLGLLSIYCFERLRKINMILGIMTAALIALIAHMIHVEGREGYILIIFMFHLLRDVTKLKQTFLWIVVILCSRWNLWQWLIEDFDAAWRTVLLNTLGPYLAIMLTFHYNGKKGRMTKALQYGMYWFYPVHLLLLAVIGFIIT